MNQELINWEEFNSDPIDLMPPSNNDAIDYIVMNRHRFIFLLVFPILFFCLKWDIALGFSISASLMTFLQSYNEHKKDEKKINKIINDYWKIRAF